MAPERTDVIFGWPTLAHLPEPSLAAAEVRALVAQFQQHRTSATAAIRANAFSAIYNHYCHAIWDYIYHQVDGADADAKDIFSQVWLVALEELDEFEYRTDTVAADPLRSWLFSCAANRIKQFYREKHAKLSFDVVESFLWAKLGGEDTSLFELFAPSVSSRANRLLYAITQTLSQEQKLILRLRYHGNLSFAEIGAYLNKNEGAVKVQHHRLLKKLRVQLDAEGQRQ